MTINAVEQIRGHHRRRRFAMKIQQKLDRALESFIRMNATEWRPDLDATERERINKEVKILIKRIREGAPSEVADEVMMSDEARKPADARRDFHEKAMETLAATLPVYAWLKTVHGAGALGLATIIAEAGDLSNYPNVAKLWKRLGFAPYDGFAGSTWKRDTWRPRALTKDEWIDNPFSGERYALIHQIAVWLVNSQWIGKSKTESGEGEPDGPYGEIYAARRKHTMTTHPDWTPGHRRMDALRVTMKAFLKDLHVQWNATASDSMKPNVELQVAEPGQRHHETQVDRAGLTYSNAVARKQLKPNAAVRPRESGQNKADAQRRSAGLTNRKAVATGELKPKGEVRPREPGQLASDAQQSVAGLTSTKSRAKSRGKERAHV